MSLPARRALRADRDFWDLLDALGLVSNTNSIILNLMHTRARHLIGHRTELGESFPFYRWLLCANALAQLRANPGFAP